MTAAVTIGMPVRNGAEYLEEAIRSLLAQREGDFSCAHEGSLLGVLIGASGPVR